MADAPEGTLSISGGRIYATQRQTIISAGVEVHNAPVKVDITEAIAVILAPYIERLNVKAD